MTHRQVTPDDSMITSIPRCQDWCIIGNVTILQYCVIILVACAAAQHSYLAPQFALMGKSTSIKVFCSGCKTHLYTYRKKGGGSLVKCFLHKILWDGTQERCVCPNTQCGSAFCRPAVIKNRAANKIIGGKVFYK